MGQSQKVGGRKMAFMMGNKYGNRQRRREGHPGQLLFKPNKL